MFDEDIDENKFSISELSWRLPENSEHRLICKWAHETAINNTKNAWSTAVLIWLVIVYMLLLSYSVTVIQYSDTSADSIKKSLFGIIIFGLIMLIIEILFCRYIRNTNVSKLNAVKNGKYKIADVIMQNKEKITTRYGTTHYITVTSPDGNSSERLVVSKELFIKADLKSRLVIVKLNDLDGFKGEYDLAGI